MIIQGRNGSPFSFPLPSHSIHLFNESGNKQLLELVAFPTGRLKNWKQWKPQSLLVRNQLKKL
jgi:hypothetical protein